MIRTIAAMALVAAACGGGGKSGEAGGLEGRWLGKTWVPASGELDGVPFTAEVPDGLPDNEKYAGGESWWTGVTEPGPRLTLDRPREQTFADPEALARHVEPDATRPDLIEVAKERTADGRLRYVSRVKGNHLDVTVWIPLDATRGVRCSAHWYGGLGPGGERLPPPGDALIPWLTRFCDSVKLAP